MIYKHFSERKPDTQYRSLLKLIQNDGEEVDTQQEEAAKKLQKLFSRE
mgnify:CR=1 FL=1